MRNIEMKEECLKQIGNLNWAIGYNSDIYKLKQKYCPSIEDNRKYQEITKTALALRSIFFSILENCYETI